MGFPTSPVQTPLSSVLNITAATLVKVGGGFVYAVGTTTGPCTLNDSATVAGVAAGNLIGTTATATGITQVNFKFNNGLVITPAAGVASVSFE